ncbi:hypothetical protein SOVF_090740 [Spinacia oleracea]|nr:hypothetical protein SOVF_090740 [Spinacia oleracea]
MIKSVGVVTKTTSAGAAYNLMFYQVDTDTMSSAKECHGFLILCHEIHERDHRP